MWFPLLDEKQRPEARLGGKHQTGAIYRLKAPTAHPSNAPGEWNTLRLVVNAGRIEHWINDKLVLSAAFQDLAINPRRAPPFPVAIQNQADSIVPFRNVKIRRLLPLKQTHLPVQAELGFPSSVVASNGEIYLLQRGLTADPIVVINREGKVLRQWGPNGGKASSKSRTPSASPPTATSGPSTPLAAACSNLRRWASSC